MLPVKKLIVRLIERIVNRFGYELKWVKNKNKQNKYPQDYSKENISIIEEVRERTMTTPVRINSLIEAVKYISNNNIEGSIVECGVWKGGSIIAIALTLNQLNDQSREIFLYDTFSGMAEPGDHDVYSLTGESVIQKFSESKVSEKVSSWSYSPLQEVKKNVFTSNYPQHLFNFIIGKVEDTIPEILPDKIALLRLDTDWYESTKHELEHLYPLLVKHGVLIIDDYGHYEGAKLAVEEYIMENNLRAFLHRVDYSCRLVIKNE
ncbi:MAG: TylF/MycF family methyltransferase [Anaerolineales bacterium]|nr:TylF/MycF family methyltransferase [Anaerolineales bacterium]